MNIIGYFHGTDPAAGLLMDGRLVAFVEEERLVRVKHAPGRFPIRSIRYCLESAGLTLSDIDCFAYGWNAPAYGDGRIQQFYDSANALYPPTPDTLAWQRRNLHWFKPERLEQGLHKELTKEFGSGHLPPLVFHPHHRSHAATAFFLSDLEQSLVLSVDGSGDEHTTAVWRGHGTKLESLWAANIPNSLGWFYSAITEYLGFEAYDGEYKVMGLAAYGRPNDHLRDALGQVMAQGPSGFDFVVDPKFIHHGGHSYSERFTDELVDLLGIEPRAASAALEPIHESLAYEAQALLEETVLRLVSHFQEQTGLRSLCIAGGVGLNVKMNSRLQRSGLFDQVVPFPIPSDSSTGIGAAIAVWQESAGRRVEPLEDLYLGPAFSDEEIVETLDACGISYRRCESIADEAAQLIAAGKVVAWFQGGMEAGPRALGGRSILADPRTVVSRDRVNGAIKFREYWRPFCPSMTEEAASAYLEGAAPAPFMIMAFPSSAQAVEEIPAVVHIDDTVRVQTVAPGTPTRYRQLLEAMERHAGVAVVLNTSFNVKGEAIVASPRDALRTFWATGIDALAIGDCLVEKPVTPTSGDLYGLGS